MTRRVSSARERFPSVLRNAAPKDGSLRKIVLSSTDYEAESEVQDDVRVLCHDRILFTHGSFYDWPRYETAWLDWLGARVAFDGCIDSGRVRVAEPCLSVVI